MNSTDHPHRPAWFDISTPDAPGVRRFYQDLFGWPVNVLDANYVLVGDDDGRPSGGIGQASPDSPYTGLVAYFPADDVDTALARAERHGATCVLSPTDTPVSHIAVFHRSRRQPRRPGQPLTGPHPPDYRTGASPV